MEPRISFVTLGVRDLQRATCFYSEVLRLPGLLSPPSITFYELGPTVAGPVPTGPAGSRVGVPADGTGFPGFTLAHNVRSAAEMDRLLAEVAAGGGRIVKPGRRADWGGYSGYFADPGDFLWEVAWNPHFPHV